MTDSEELVVIIELCKTPKQLYSMTQPYIRAWKGGELVFAKFCTYMALIAELKTLGYTKDCLTVRLIV